MRQQREREVPAARDVEDERREQHVLCDADIWSVRDRRHRVVPVQQD